MKMPTRKQIEADIEYWKELADLIPGWRLMGWTDRQGATYVTPSHWGTPGYTDVVNLTGKQRDEIVAAIKGK